jgi:hypothetical protein
MGKNMGIAGKLCGGLPPFAIMLVLSVATFQTEAKATMVALGSYSSNSGTVTLSPAIHTGGVPDIYIFALTDHAQVSGQFISFAGSMDVDLVGGPTTFAHTTAPAGVLVSLSIADLGPGLYGVSFSGATGGAFSGFLNFTAVAATPIPATLPLFISALDNLSIPGRGRMDNLLKAHS